MEDNKLNFNQPIPSVRRLLYFKKDHYTGKDKSTPSKVESKPICNRARVPFTWEQSPGRPKSIDPPENHDNIQHPEPALREEIPKVRKQDSGKAPTACVRASDSGDGYRMDGRDLKIDQLTLDHTNDWASPGDYECDTEKCIYQDATHIVPYFRQNVIEQESDDICRKSPLKMCGIFRFSNPAPGRNQVYSKQHISKKNGDSGKACDKTLYVDATHKVKPSLTKKDFRNLPRSERIKETGWVDTDKDPYKYGQVVDKWDGEIKNLESKKVDRLVSFELPVPPGLPKSPADPLTVPSATCDNRPVWSKTTAGDVEIKVKGETRKAHKSNSLVLEERRAPIHKRTKKPLGSNKACNAYAFGLTFN